MKSIYNSIIKDKKRGKKSLVILIDPDKINLKKIDKLADKIHQSGANYVFVGGSLLSDNSFEKTVEQLKKSLKIPVIIFPGNNLQISKYADAILFLSLISGRNPEYLIGQQVTVAPLLAKTKLEVISTGYILIESGKTTSVEYISNTKPIPQDKPDIAVATALAGQMLGMKMIYLEAGSGASKPVSEKMIQSVSKHLKIPVIVGGGIRTKKQIQKTFKAGADIVVVGTAFEDGEVE